MNKELYEDLKKYMAVAYEQKMLKNDYSYNKNFSFFLTVSDQYKKENFHSDLLKVILNPKTIQIGSPNHLQNFLEIIGLGKKAFGNELSIKKYVQVEREEHRVDLLIKYNNPKSKKAIIIENKINNAEDQENQLARYYKKLTEEGYTVVSIPYITKFGGKIPDYNSWDKEYKKYSNTIFNDEKPLFFDLPVDGQNKGKDLKVFLDKCIQQYKMNKQLTENENLALLFLEQYKLLLEKIVEDHKMTPEDVKNIKKIFDDEKKFQIQALLESWELRGACAFDYIKAKCSGKDNIGLKTIYGSECLVIEQKNKYYEGVYLYPSESCIQIGFYRKNYWGSKITKEAENFIKKIVKDYLNTTIDNDWILVYKNWYSVNITIDQFESFDKINLSFRKALIELSKFKS